MTIFNITYHYAHTNCKKADSSVELVDQSEGIAEITCCPISEKPILVKFSSNGIKSLFSEDQNIRDITLEIDSYSGVVAIQYKIYRGVSHPESYQNITYKTDNPYIYHSNLGCISYEKIPPYKSLSFDKGIISYKPSHDFGYIMEHPPRLTIIFDKELSTVQNLQQGILKVKTSKFDEGGYIVHLFPEAILNITQSICANKEEAREEKEYTLSSIDNSADLYNTSSVDLLGNDTEVVDDVYLHG